MGEFSAFIFGILFNIMLSIIVLAIAIFFIVKLVEKVKSKPKGEIYEENINAIFVIVLVLTSTVVTSFAEEEEGIESRYLTAITVTSKVTLSGSNATYFAEVIPRNPTSIDSIKATIKLVNDNGTVIDSTSGTMKKSSVLFNIADTATLTKKGNYHAEYTLKIYKSGVLKETITGKSISVKY